MRSVLLILVVVFSSNAFSEITVHKKQINEGLVEFKVFNDNKLVHLKIIRKDGALVREEGTIPDGSARYIENGKIKYIVDYRNGKKNGTFIEYNEKGRIIAKWACMDDVLNGICKGYNESGEIMWEQKYSKGKRDGPLKEMNGETITEWNYENDKLNGISRSYYGSGRIKWEINFKNGKKDGTAKDYYKSGILRTSTTWVTGKRNGILSEYDEDGCVRTEANYINDEINGIKREIYKSGKIRKAEFFSEFDLKPAA